MGVYQTSRRGTNAKKHQRLATDYLCPVAAPDPAGPRQPIWSGWRAHAFPLVLPRLQLTAEPGPHCVAVGSTQRQLGPGGEKDRVFAVERRLQLPDSRQVDDRRPMDPGKPGGIQPGFEAPDGFAHEVLLPSRMEPDIVVGSLHPVEVLYCDESDPTIRLHQYPLCIAPTTLQLR